MTSALGSLLGATRPRVELRPPTAGESFGAEAAELSALAGWPLEDWQVSGLELMLSTRPDGRWACREYGEILGRQQGKTTGLGGPRALSGLLLFGEELIMWSAHEYKDLDVATPILTTRGWSTMGGLRAGDEVYAPDGQPTKVLAAHPFLVDSDCYRITFADGQSVVAGAGHLWAVSEVHRSGRTERRVATTDEIRRTGLLHRWNRPNGRDRNVYRWRVDLPAPVQTPDADLPIDPYLLGVWLGDGDSAGGRLTVGAEDLPDLLSELDALGERYSVADDKRAEGRVKYVGIYGLRAKLRAVGVLGAKRIPDVYLTASVDQRRALLAGIMDTDGGVCGHQLVVTMMNLDLMADVAVLVRSLGYRATERTFRAKLNGCDTGPMYRVQFAPNGVSPFRLARKTDRIVTLRKTRSAYNAITSIERVPTRQTRCITVAHESSSYLVGRGFVPTHNTAIEAFLRVRDAFRRLGEDAGLNLIALDGGRITVKVNNTNGEEGFELSTGQRLRFIARSKGSGRGFSGDCNIIDEAFAYTRMQQSALAPTMSARKNPQTIYLSSPPLNGLSGEVLYALAERAARRDERLGWRDWGLATPLDDVEGMSPRERAAFLDDRRNWAASLPALGRGRVDEEAIDQLRRELDDRDFAREMLGCWPKQVTARSDVIDLGVWQDRADGQSRPGEALVFALDVSPGGRSAAIASSGRRADGRLHVKVVDYRPGTGWAVARLAELQERWTPRKILLDKGGPAEALLADLAAAGVDVQPAAFGDMTQACGAFVNDLVEDRIRHCDQQALNDAVAQATTRPVRDSWLWARKDTSADICPLVAVTLAAHGFRLYGSQEEVIPWAAWV